MLSQVFQGNIMVEEIQMDTNPALIDLYLQALLMRESTGNYEAKHKSSIIKDSVTGKPIKVQALGGYGILDINFPVWARQAGLNGFSMSDGDWKDPKVQDAVARYKVQQYFNKFNSWEAVSVAWFAGEGKANELVSQGTIDYNKADSNGTTIKQYVATMNNFVAEELMNIEVPMETFEKPQIYSGPTPVSKGSRNNNEVYAAQILDAMTRATAGGVRPNLTGDARRQASNVRTAIDNAKAKGESTIDVSMATEKNPNSARELGMNR